MAVIEKRGVRLRVGGDKDGEGISKCPHDNI
jgi:hypothetical protein